MHLPGFAWTIFEALGVDAGRIRIAAADVNVPHLILPSCQFMHGIKASPGMCVVFDHIRERIRGSRRRSHSTPAKVYFSRRNLGAVRGSGLPRKAIANEDEAEAVFRKRGFEIIEPETLPIEEQVAIAAGATDIAGASGSALHLVLFNNDPCTKLIELRTKTSFNQLLISSIRGSRAFHIWCRASRASDSEVVLKLDVIERAMDEIE